MSRDKYLFPIVLGVVILGVLIFLLLPKVEEKLAPQPVAAWVAVEVAGSGVARVAPASLKAGEGFTLHAVLEGRDRSGQAVYYTEAPRLEIHGKVIEAEALRRWGRARPPKFLWFTVEGGAPLREVASLDNLAAYALEEIYRPDFPNAWTIPGVLEGGRKAPQDSAWRQEEASLGTQRYHVRIEIYADDKALLPEQRFKSWGAESLPEKVAEFPSVTASLPGVLGPASEIVGLAQLEPTPEAGEEVLVQLAVLTRQRLAFSRLAVVAEAAEVAGLEPTQLPWQEITLGQELHWGDAVHPGDLLQASDRVVFLVRDLGRQGILDSEDLCLDMIRGAALRPLREVFAGEGELRWAPLGGSPTPSSSPSASP
jgi:hypothetical protein